MKKLRNIRVDGENYKWYASRDHLNDGDGTQLCLVKIWKDKKLKYEKVFEGDVQVTPSIISETIKNL